MARAYLREKFVELTSSPDGFTRQLMELRVRTKMQDAQLAPTYVHALSRTAVNRNRYVDILASDDSRVPLIEPVTGSDYINASLVPVPNAHRRYICTQGPKAETAAHFWQMVHEQDSHLILFMGQFVERNIDKVFPYFPSRLPSQQDDEKEQRVTFGRYEVALKDCTVHTSYIRREFELRVHPADDETKTPTPTDEIQEEEEEWTDEEESQPHLLYASVAKSIRLSVDVRTQLNLCATRTSVEDTWPSPTKRARSSTVETRHVVHFQFIEWKDFGAPNAVETMLHFLRDVRQTGRLNCDKYGPAVVHCSAGVGRTGTFILIDATLAMLSLSDKWTPAEIDINQQLVAHRVYRVGLVQTPAQLAYAWATVVRVLADSDDGVMAVWADVMANNNVSPVTCDNPKTLLRAGGGDEEVDCSRTDRIVGSLPTSAVVANADRPFSYAPHTPDHAKTIHAQQAQCSDEVFTDNIVGSLPTSAVVLDSEHPFTYPCSTTPGEPTADHKPAVVQAMPAALSQTATRATGSGEVQREPMKAEPKVETPSTSSGSRPSASERERRVNEIRARMAATDKYNEQIRWWWPRLMVTGTALGAAALSYFIYRYNQHI